MDDLLKELNEPQQQAVTTTEGPVIVIAGAGSGKTRVITYRVAHLIAERKANPQNILAVTFTNRAAEEMRSRIYRLLGATDLESWIGTFHATCARLLRREAECLGYKPDFAIYDEADQRSLVKYCMNALRISERDFSARLILARISSAKNRMLSPEAYEGTAVSRLEERVAAVYKRYQTALRASNAMDFDDLLNNALAVMLEHRDREAKYRTLFKYIHVDEFQDTNKVQYHLVKEFAGEYRNLCVVGDDDQSIYSWRGANIENLWDFQKDFPEAATVFLEENYRSTELILDAANMVIENNRDRKKKRLWTKNKGGDKVLWYPAFNEHAEAQYIVDAIRTFKGLHPEMNDSDFAVFYRTNAQSRVLEDEFRSNGLPYTIVGSVRFYERMEIKDILAYLRVIANPRDSVSLRRIINVPARGIGKTTLDRAEAFASKMNIPLLEAIGRANEITALRGNARERLLAFRNFILRLAEEGRHSDASVLIGKVIEASGYADMLGEEGTFQAKTRLENLDELISAAVEIGEKLADRSLGAFLENVSLQTDIDEWDTMDEAITLMTLHTAKGLEFPVVFISGMEENLFPHSNAFTDRGGIEEERRLCYVGFTRAKRRLILTSADTRRIQGQQVMNAPSRFIDEIGEEFLDSIGPVREQHERDSEYYQDMPDYEGREFSVGDMVEHATFGSGRINAVSGSGSKLKVAVRFFRDNKQRNLLVKFAGLHKK